MLLKRYFRASAVLFAGVFLVLAGVIPGRALAADAGSRQPLMKLAQAAPQAVPASTAPASATPAAPVFSERGAATCMQCHNEAPVTNILSTPHATKGDSRTPFGQHECESCHGPSDAHVAGFAKGAPVSPTVVFKGPKASPVAERNQVCLGLPSGQRT